MYHVIHRYGSGYEYEECCTGTNVHVVMSDVESVHFFEYLKPFRQVVSAVGTAGVSVIFLLSRSVANFV